MPSVCRGMPPENPVWVQSTVMGTSSTGFGFPKNRYRDNQVEPSITESSQVYSRVLTVPTRSHGQHFGILPGTEIPIRDDLKYPSEWKTETGKTLLDMKATTIVKEV